MGEGWNSSADLAASWPQWMWWTTMLKHPETHSQTWIPSKGLPAEDVSSSCLSLQVSPGWADRAHFQTSIIQPVSLFELKGDLPYFRPKKMYLTTLGEKKRDIERWFWVLRTHRVFTADFILCFIFKEPPFKQFCWIDVQGFCLSGLKELRIFVAQPPVNQGWSLRHWQTLQWSGVSRGCPTASF